jgi:transposase
MPQRTDPKHQTLRAHGTLHARPELVTDPLFCDSPFFDPHDALQVKYEMLRRVRVDGVAVLHAARAFGMSRPSYYQAAEAFERGGIGALLPAKRGPRHAHKLSDDVLVWVRAKLHDAPSLTASELAKLIHGQFGIEVHPRSIERALARAEKKTR